MNTDRCVAESDETNNNLNGANCVPFHVHEPLPNLTPWRDIYTYNNTHAPYPLDTTLNGLTDTTQPVRDQNTPNLLWVEVRNIGEAATKNPVWVEFWTDGTLQQRKQTANAIPAGGSEIVTFDWQPKSNFNNVIIKVDDPNDFHCNTHPWGCELEYNDEYKGINDNDTKRALPELEAIDIQAK